MTFLASSAAALWAQVTLWTGRANQAWGASRVWNTGQSFEVDRNAAYDGGAWGSGNLWSADAHNDPNVWTNRYNAGAASKTTSGLSTSAFSGAWPNSTSVYSGNLASLTSPRAGNALVGAQVVVNSTVGTHGQARLLVNGGVVATAAQTGHNNGGGTIAFPVFWQGNLNAGDVVTVQVASDGATTLASGLMDLTVGSV